jgi:hypothetical protein
MAAMTQHPNSRGIPTVVGNLVPVLGSVSPPTFKVGVVGTARIKCRNVAFGSRFQINGVDDASVQWLSPSTLIVTYTPASVAVQEGQVITPDGLTSNKVKIYCVA